ncbi:MAG: hypothetical protein OK454_12290, partial [Thaumarchaeota archaeon]|nr:hypothetical protein [Nitrososphaerota archaeon]
AILSGGVSRRPRGNDAPLVKESGENGDMKVTGIVAAKVNAIVIAGDEAAKEAGSRRRVALAIGDPLCARWADLATGVSVWVPAVDLSSAVAESWWSALEAP